MKSKPLFIICFLLTLSAVTYSQEIPTDAEQPLVLDTPGGGSDEELSENPDDFSEIIAEEDPVEEEEIVEEKLTPAERRRTELEIKASTLSELAVWCRSLGLSEGGTKADLSKRIRDHFNLPEPKDNDENRKILTIESAQTTEYFKIDTIDEDYARLKGDVRLVLQDKNDVHRIKADEILFNRSRNIITARGNVEYRKEKGDTTETFRGENITVNIDDWSSVFLAGDSEKTLENENTAYRFEGTVISRSADDATILNKANIRNANNEEALWSISASKLWLLPGSDFAVFNALLKVGEIPVLYFPFFYYPADDFIFHPVVGYRTREGGFIQTSTYILGRPKVDTAEQSSITSILGSGNDMIKERNGIFLRSTGKKSKETNETTLKAMVDYYVNLGLYTGLDFTMPQKGILSSLELSLGIGFTRTLSMIDGDYTPYAPNYDGTVEWNNSNLFSKVVPFRYRMKTQSSLRGKYGSFAWNIPFYSDPYTDIDFLDRAEAMDWVNMIQQGAEREEEDILQQETNAYQWHLNGNISPSIGFLSPYISNFSISNISTTLSFKKIQDKEITASNSEHPGRNFFAPDKYTIYNVSSSVSGTPLSIGNPASSANTNTNTSAKTEPEDPFKGIGRPRPPWEELENDTEKKSTEDKLIPPVLNKTFDLPRTGKAKFSIDYQLSPTSSSELQFMSGYDRWKTLEDINWSEVQSVLSNFGGNGTLNFRMDHSEGLISNMLSFTGNGTWREYTYLNDEAEAYRTPQTSEGAKDEQKIEAAKKQQYSLTNYSSSYTYNTTLKPLYKDPTFGQSSLQYTLGGTLVKSKKYTDGDGPELTPQWGTFQKEETKDGEEIIGLKNHRFTSNVAANVMNKQQNITVSADLPPFDPFIQTNATFRAWISETNARMDFKKPEMFLNEPNDEWKLDPLHLTETLKFGTKSTLSYYMVMDPEDDYKTTTITSSLTLWDFRASFSAVKMAKWEFIPDNPDAPTQGGKWVQHTEEEPSINPRDLTFSYSKSLPARDIIKNRLGFSVNVNTRLFFDLQRHTNSNFQFTLGATLKITNFMDLSISATSENAVVFRYFKGVPGMEDLTKMYLDGPQNNVFTDLIDSFNFFDDSKRQRSGFKMKTFRFGAVHHLGDWDATLEVSMIPYLDRESSPPKYEVNSEVSFLVKWSAISEIKTDLKYEKRTEKWTKN
ncbi:MAG: LPS-assembly protein LptD [Treponema sp.]|jgi:lipopolysaccharide assembly outer membrane protein LptD (OstA)|nr:LPS-assembly protein LptD [Treponema sp.]